MAIRINVFLYTFSLTTIFLVSGVLEGPNVCVRQENYTVTVNISQQKSYKARQNTWCMVFTLKCSTYKTIVRTVYTTQVLQKQRPVEECCKGYGKTATGDECVPICSQDCKHGSCIAPDSCICEAGYGGSACDTSKYASVTSEPVNLNIDRKESDEEHDYEVPYFYNNDNDYNHLDHARSQNNRKSNYQKILKNSGSSEMTNQNDRTLLNL
ncbi:hypothetical protein HCN44_005182 [Aphidius gifuensis]|uniref:EMI domain-containing protein n=1 Tax=Aphidius gifuensis TaxID=684658 RepID=A0A835CT26_APHGI|nr:hypothetical protein HCN44_005182 [Aphidius gifuensis]